MSDKFAFWKTMDSTHKVTFVLLMVVTVSFPVFLLALMNPKLPMFSRASSPATPPDPVDYCEDIPGNLIDNFNFESGKSGWNFQKTSDGKFTSADDTYSCTKVGRVVMAKNAKAQLSQNKITLQPNTTYEVSFAAKANSDRTLDLYIHQHRKPYTNYGLEYTARLSTDWQTFATTFTTPAEVDPNSRLRFWFAGRKGDQYWIDNVVVKKYLQTFNGPRCGQPSIPPQSGPAPLGVWLHGASEVGDLGAGLVGYRWDFEGDGIWDTEATTLDAQYHTYLVSGTYIPKFQVLDTNSNLSPICEYPYQVVVTGVTNTPTPTPTPVASKRVFVTSTTYNGNLGGLSGADAKCQERADAANLGGMWRAWLSDINVSASDRLIHSGDPYILLNSTRIANNWSDLTDGTINHAIDVDEFSGYQISKIVLTNTQPDGTKGRVAAGGFYLSSCDNWFYSGSDLRGNIGENSNKDASWTMTGEWSCSDRSMHLYCFEQ